ncbi:prepilin-type N-terminal cleavage/methylation domain-containing protein [Shewanella sp. 10N.286.45.A1]|uniref:pilin n=1 Tax=Shewanella sp. 10N.286.45.A1 TaxID=3229694 RepID=UPI00354CFF41
MRQYQKGFSLIELVIVIVILGLLAATAIPHYLNVTEEAEDASVDGVSGGLATAVSFVRSQWEVDGRNNPSVVLDGTTIALDTRFGFPTGVSNTSATSMTNPICKEVFDNVLQNAPRNVLSTGQDARGMRYTVNVENGAGGEVIGLDGSRESNVDLCVYYLVVSLTLNDNGRPTPAPTRDPNTGYKFITYNPGNGQVQSFIN